MFGIFDDRMMLWDAESQPLLLSLLSALQGQYLWPQALDLLPTGHEGLS